MFRSRDQVRDGCDDFGLRHEEVAMTEDDKKRGNVREPEPTKGSDGYEPPAVRVLGSLEELTQGGNQPVTDGLAGAS